RRAGDGPLLAGVEQPAEHLLPLELLAPAVLLDDHVGNLVDALVGGKALVASIALAPPPDRVRLFALARIHHAVLREAAVGTSHRSHIAGDKINLVDRTILSARVEVVRWKARG